MRLPPVIFTDGDDAMYAAIAYLPYSEDIRHLICTFHLFDQNLKRTVQHILTSSAGASSLASFRKCLSICRQAISEDDLGRLWSDTMNEWFPQQSVSHVTARSYLFKLVWSKRRQWSVAFSRIALHLEHLLRRVRRAVTACYTAF